MRETSLKIIFQCNVNCNKNNQLYKGRALNKRQFAQFLEEFECQYSRILTHNNVQSLSFVQVLKRFVMLLEETNLFVIEKDNSFEKLSNLYWLNDVMFLCEFTQYLNGLKKNL